jgi:putative transposase
VTARIVAERANHHIPYATSCRALGVSESWFYHHKDRPPTPSQVRRGVLDAAITKTFEAHDGTYGSPRIVDELREEGWTVGENTVARRMQTLGLRAKTVKKGRSLTRPDKTTAKFGDLLCRSFTTPTPDVAWVGDITEISTWEKKLYVATVIDLYSRRLIGWAIGERHTADLACDALRMAYAVRGNAICGVIFHTDRGSEYTSRAFTSLCNDLGVVQSMSRAGSCLDNAVAESFFATFKTELIYRNVLATARHANQLIVAWFDRYNRVRRHSHCGNQAPLTYEEATTFDTTRAA